AARIDPLPVRPGFPPSITGFPANQSSWLYNAIVPLSARYDPDGTHGGSSAGARATTYDHNVNTFGRDENGFARRPLDNVGIQYGLAALNAGDISTAQFLDLNEKTGGLDIVIWSGVCGPRARVITDAFTYMAAWLDNMTADTAAGSPARKIARNKPTSLTDGCWTGAAAPFVFVAERQVLGGPGTSTCNTQYPGYLFPRYMAGMPLSNDIVKCQLRRIDLADYHVRFTADQLARLGQIFPDGVCDYSRPGVAQHALLG